MVYEAGYSMMVVYEVDYSMSVMYDAFYAISVILSDTFPLSQVSKLGANTALLPVSCLFLHFQWSVGA